MEANVGFWQREFGDDLSACPTGWKLMPEGDDGKSGDFHVRAFSGYGMEDGVSLSADGQPVAGIFDIAAGVQRA